MKCTSSIRKVTTCVILLCIFFSPAAARLPSRGIVSPRERIRAVAGGNIWIDSQKGRGTKVCFSIPAKSYKTVSVSSVNEVAAQ